MKAFLYIIATFVFISYYFSIWLGLTGQIPSSTSTCLGGLFGILSTITFLVFYFQTEKGEKGFAIFSVGFWSVIAIINFFAYAWARALEIIYFPIISQGEHTDAIMLGIWFFVAALLSLLLWADATEHIDLWS